MKFQKQLLVCHGRLHKSKKPRYMHRKYHIDFKNATHLDMNILSIPDICADLTDASTVTKMTSNTFDVIIPMYAHYHVYGESWQNKPNQVFLDVVLKSLKIGGTVVMCPASGFFEDETETETDPDDDNLKKGLIHLFPITHIPECYFHVIIEAYERTQYDQEERHIVTQQLKNSFPNIGSALSYMESSIPVTRKCKKRRRFSTRDKLNHFASSVVVASSHRLCLVASHDVFISKDYLESCLVFKKLS